MAKTYPSRALAEAHENARDLYRLGLIDKKTMRSFDRSCLTPVKRLSPAAIVDLTDNVSSASPTRIGDEMQEDMADPCKLVNKSRLLDLFL